MMSKFIKDRKWKRKAFIFLDLIVLLGLFAVMIPAQADDSGCTDKTLGYMWKAPRNIDSHIIDSKLIGSFVRYRNHQWVTYNIYRDTYLQTIYMEKIWLHRLYCCCAKTHRCAWSGKLIKTDLGQQQYDGARLTYKVRIEVTNL